MVKNGYLLSVLFLVSACVTSPKSERLTSYVDPFIGTDGHGHTYPGAVVPFGMVQVSPDNGTQGWDWCSGYHYSDSMIAGFSHTHLSGTGIGDLCDISVLPVYGVPFDTSVHRSRFSHSTEEASPGYYKVQLDDYKVRAELTATNRTALHRYQFQGQESDGALLVNLGFAINWDKAVEGYLHRIDDHTIAGYRYSTGWAKKQRVYFALRTEQRIDSMTLYVDKQLSGKDSGRGEHVMAYLHLKTRETPLHHVKVAISSASEAGAIAGLDSLHGHDFETVRQAASDSWERELNKIVIETKDTAKKRMFYTALYHTMLAPVTFNDALGQYKGANDSLAIDTGTVYSVFSLWDTFRGNNPLFTVMHPDRVSAMIRSMLAFYRQHGLLPVWDLHFNETNTMTGYHAIPVIADAILKGIPGFDYELAYEAMQASTNQSIRGSEAYRKYGYVPQDAHGWSVTMTLEYAFDDWCMAQVAKRLGKTADAALYTNRSANYRNLFDSTTGFFRAKKMDGSWVEPFDPYRSEHGFDGQYIEGTAWQHTFFVPHAVEDYARLLGGQPALVAKLDSLFTTTSVMTGDNVSVDITGLIGQYAHGNEPSHHIAYMYTALGQQPKAAQRLNQIVQTMYSDKPNGLTGNEDCGQMSAWLVWTMLGMYPMNPASGQYMFGLPMVDAATIALPGGKELKIEVKRSKENALTLSKAMLNGKLLNTPYLTHTQLVTGGKLLVELSE